METKQFQNLLESIINLSEDHMKGKTVIVNGKRGVVGKEVSKDGQTEGDEFYRVKFEDGSVKDIPARDMEMAGNTKNKKQPSENEAEDIANESVELDEAGDPRIGKMSRKAQEILANMANSLDTTGGPYLDKTNVKYLTRRGVENTLKAAKRIPKGNKRAAQDLAILKKELGESIELEEMSAKDHYRKFKNKGRVSPIDRERFPNREREGLEGPYRVKKSGLIYYYDKKAGKYYDPQADMYLDVKDVMEQSVDMSAVRNFLDKRK